MGSSACGILFNSKKHSISSNLLTRNMHGMNLEPNKEASMKIITNNQGQLVYVRRNDLQKSERILNIMQKFYLKDHHLEEIWTFFKKIDVNGTGYIKPGDLYILLHEPQTSIISPFVDRFFILIEKEFHDKATFEEFLPNLISYCLFSIYQIVEFVFHMIDKNHDGFISRVDVIKLLELRRSDHEIYLLNHAWAVDDYRDVKRSDKISKEEFADLCNKLSFIYFPAVLFQTNLRMYYLSESFWNKLGKEVKNAYMNNIKQSEYDRINMKIDKIKNKLFEDKVKKFQKFNAGGDENLEVKENKIYKEDIRLMKMRRKNSDTDFYLGVFEENKKLKKLSKEAESVCNMSIHDKS